MKLVTSFAITGQVQGVELPKYLQIGHQGSRVRVKLAKHLRPLLLQVQVGQWIRLGGQQEIKLEGQEKTIRYKATDLMLLQADQPPAQPEPAQIIQICTKGSCRKQGSLDLLAALSQSCPAGVEVVPSGCLKNCKAGPNVALGSRQIVSRATPERVWQCLQS